MGYYHYLIHMRTPLNIAIYANRARIAVYPSLACEATARAQMAAAAGARLHALGPGTGGDGPAASRPLRPPHKPPSTPSTPSTCTRMCSRTSM